MREPTEQSGQPAAGATSEEDAPVERQVPISPPVRADAPEADPTRSAIRRRIDCTAGDGPPRWGHHSGR
jgi:hypothetical protein